MTSYSSRCFKSGKPGMDWPPHLLDRELKAVFLNTLVVPFQNRYSTFVLIELEKK